MHDMASKAPTDDGKRKRKGQSIVVWILMVLLIIGLGGFGITNYGGGVSTIGSVGTKDITTTQYARALQQELAAMRAQLGQTVTMEQARAFGIDTRVSQQLIVAAALGSEADRIGLSVSDARLAQEVTAMDAFKGTTGNFDAETYRFTLERNNLTEAEFESNVREDLSRTVLQGAVVGGFVAPQVLTDTLYAYLAERRGLSVLRLTEADLPAPLPDPTEAELQAFHAANIADFTRPEAKRISYASLLPETLATSLTVDEAELQKLYQSRIDEFVQPERRLVERLVYPDQAAADAAKARLDAGETFETLVAERGLTLDAIDLGDASKAELGAAGEAVFALAEPGVVGPLDSDLGPALFRMNAILSAQETTFDEARADLVIEAQQEAARRAIADRVEEIDDQLASGATLEDLVRDAGLTLGTIDFSSESRDAIAGYPAFREAAEALGEGDFPEAVLLEDGGLVVLRLDEVVPPSPIPLAEAMDAVTEAWRADALAKALAARAEEIKAELAAGANLGAYGILSVTPEIARDGFIEDVPETLVPAAFQMAVGEVQLIDEPGFTGLLRLDSILPAIDEGEGAAALKEAIAAQGEQALAQDAFALFSASLAAEAGIRLDSAAISAVQAQFP
jgi:peptidyl-prolyl cis-trans isomerase D